MQSYELISGKSVYLLGFVSHLRPKFDSDKSDERPFLTKILDIEVTV